tara:strand:+ start:14 stop:520 length:507 start_codon:yes stop_codon:yes gene_type:complete
MANNFYTGERFNRHTICENGEGQIAGRLGEAEFARLLCLHSPSFSWIGAHAGPVDFEVHLTQEKSISVDVKTKLRTVRAKPHYDAHVTLSQKNYDVDIYVFASMNERDANRVELISWCSKPWFWRNARTVQAGDKDEDGYIEEADAGKMKYSNMTSIDVLWEKIEGYA